MENLSDPPLTKYSRSTHVHAIGLRYEVSDGITLRASRSIGFKPPSLTQALPDDPPPLPTSTMTINDPLRSENGIPERLTLNGTQWVTGGNPDLMPENSYSTNIGAIFAPARLSGLRISVDYLHSIRHNAITSLSAQALVDAEADLPGHIIRGTPDGHPSGIGPIVFIDQRYFNANRIASKSLDISIGYRKEHVFGGRLTVSMAATRNISFVVQTSALSPPVEQVRSRTSVFAQQLEWNGNGQVQWEGASWGFGWSARYFDYILAATRDFTLQGADRAPWKVDHDFNVTYRVPPRSTVG